MTRKGFRNFFVAPRSWRARLGMVLAGLCVLATCVVIRYCWGTATAKAQVSAEPAKPNSAPVAAPPGDLPRFAPVRSPTAAAEHMPIPDVVAAVNGHAISRDELAVECRVHYGKEVLESMVNKYLILAECRQMGITITRPEVDAEIEQMARSFNLPVEQWLNLLWQAAGNQAGAVCQRHHLAQSGVAEAGGRRGCRPRQKELTDAFEMEYGAAVKARLITCTTAEKAQKVQALAAANPDDFGNLANSIRKTPPAPASRAWSRRSASMALAPKSKRPPSDWPTARFPESSAARANT